jgi:hypothetical protein
MQKQARFLINDDGRGGYLTMLASRRPYRRPGF